MKKLPTSPFLVMFQQSVLDCCDMLEELSPVLLDRDFESLSTVVREYGVEPIFLLKLPELCSDLEYSLQIGWYKRRAQGPLTALNGSVMLPRFLCQLYQRIFSDAGVILDNPCWLSVKCLRQLLRCFKKFDIECTHEVREKSTDAFIGIEYELPSPQLSWGSDQLRVTQRFPNLVDLVNVSLRQQCIIDRLNVVHPDWTVLEIQRLASTAQGMSDRIMRNFKPVGFMPKHGPGAVSEGFHTSKYEFPTWNSRLERLFPYAEWGVFNACHIRSEGDDESAWNVEVPAKFAFVPKDYKGPRIIASESIAYQFVQQGLNSAIRNGIQNSVLRKSIDLRSQEPSREAALAASVDGNQSTIDLSSASDRLSCATVECLFRANFGFLELLNSSRARGIYIKHRKMTLLSNKFAGQGAAVTFPVQSICYALICAAVLMDTNPRLRASDAFRKVRIFGDDMIVPTDEYSRIASLLTCLHLVVNPDKSFSNGLFRESCGMDAFMGHDVTPGYVKSFSNPRKPASVKSLLDCSNNLYIRGFIRAAGKLLDFLPTTIRKELAYGLPGSSGNCVWGPNIWAKHTRWNKKLQRREFRTWALISKVEKTDVSASFRLLQWAVESPAPDAKDWQPGEVKKKSEIGHLIWVDHTDLLGR